MTWSGTVKLVYLKKWMRLRKSIEHEEPPPSSSSSSSTCTATSKVVECPRLSDVIFRRGTSLYCHPGNARFRSLVEQKVCLHYPSILSMIGGTLAKDLIKEIIGAIVTKENGGDGRVLVWNHNHNDDKYGCWCTLTNERQIYSKIEFVVRDFIRNSVVKAEKQKKNRQMNESGTSIFQSQSQSQSKQPANALFVSTASVSTSSILSASTSTNKRLKPSPSSSDDDTSCCGGEGT